MQPLYLKRHVGLTLHIAAFTLIAILTAESVLATTPPPGFVDASTYGWNPTDATACLEAALRASKKVFVPKMASDWIVTPITLQSWNQTIIFEDGVTVSAKAGEFHDVNDSLFTVVVGGVSMIGPGATLKMRQADYTQAPYAPSEWRNAVELRGVSNFTIDGLTIKDTGGDGIYVGDKTTRDSYCENVTIKNVTINRSYRNGISVISAKNLLIDNCTILNTSGTNPQAGIDFEPNNDVEILDGCTVRNTIINSSSEEGILFALQNFSAASIANVKVDIDNVTIKSSGDSGIRLYQYAPGVTIKDSLILKNADYGVRGVQQSGHRNVIQYSDVWNNGDGSFNNITAGTGVISLEPMFYAVGSDDPYYMYLDPSCSPLITHGASDGGYMGARPVYSVPEPTAAMTLICGAVTAIAFGNRSRRREGRVRQ